MSTTTVHWTAVTVQAEILMTQVNIFDVTVKQ